MSASKTPGTSGNAGIAVNGCRGFLGFVPGVPTEQLAVCGSPFAVLARWPAKKALQTAAPGKRGTIHRLLVAREHPFTLVRGPAPAGLALARSLSCHKCVTVPSSTISLGSDSPHSPTPRGGM